ncbi:CdaR family transcriptional regulator [Halobacillus sp. K22]|uniref:CdaR family transcriptional regulator n=1 Tax=Halobacillus sp. K22 TaxID=3457431 RepID=UPI003FCD0416
MELTDQLGREIINRLSKYIDVPINLMNPQGKIVASTDPTRIGQSHGGAITVIETTEPQFITAEEVTHYSNVKPGANLPIFHRGRLAGVVGLTGRPEQVTQAAGMTQGSVEIALEQIYIQRQAFYQERQWNHWLQQLLQTEAIDREELVREASYTLRVDVNRTWQVLVFQAEEPFELAESLQTMFLDEDYLFILPYQDNMVIAVLHYPDASSLPFNDIDSLIGVGEPGFSVHGIRQSFKQACEAIDLSGTKGEPIYSRDLQMERLLHNVNADTFHEVTEVYQNRLQQLEQVYRITLTQFFKQDMKMSRTAEVLHIHRNTLIYRLDQLTRKVGLDPRHFKDAVILQTILIHF